MVLVPAGPFRMGSAENDLFSLEHEKPLRDVALSAFWIDIYPVTNARYARFIEAEGYDRSDLWCDFGWNWRTRHRIERPAMWNVAGWDGPDQPVAGVSWYEADAYSRWSGKRLPTDAQWEKAARGTDGRRYPWGDEWPDATRANFDNLVGRTTPVGLYLDGVSAYGCHDMAGNVNNWVVDWYWEPFGRYCVDRSSLRDPILDDNLRDRLGPDRISEKVDRGGGFATSRELQEILSCTRKVHWPPTNRDPWNGFRTALDDSHLQNAITQAMS
jgi:formylglycine-generating enzyme required for sulfatase activity